MMFVVRKEQYSRKQPRSAGADGGMQKIQAVKLLTGKPQP